jgi:hypothetical protein
VVLHAFERMELKNDYDHDGLFPSINASVDARLGSDLTVHTGRKRAARNATCCTLDKATRLTVTRRGDMGRGRSVVAA